MVEIAARRGQVGVRDSVSGGFGDVMARGGHERQLRQWAPVPSRHLSQTEPQVFDDGLDRKVFCVLGVPVDSINMEELVASIRRAVSRRMPLLVSTPNLNFVTNSATSSSFRDSLVQSGVCAPDGIGLTFIARLLGIPIRQRVAGSDLLDVLRDGSSNGAPLGAFLFGGEEGVADQASKMINTNSSSLTCVGQLNPGFGSVNDMSREDIIRNINRSSADLLIVSLGAVKGQDWLLKNHDRLSPPVRTHLGAALNFQAGYVKRAPVTVRKLGLEWLWRIKEEPKLWRRYMQDGVFLSRLLVTHISFLSLYYRLSLTAETLFPCQLKIDQNGARDEIELILQGDATARSVDQAVAILRDVLGRRPSRIVVNVEKVRFIDARFFGLLLVVEKLCWQQSTQLKIEGAKGQTRRALKRNAMKHLMRGRR